MILISTSDAQAFDEEFTKAALVRKGKCHNIDLFLNVLIYSVSQSVFHLLIYEG